MRCRPLFFFLSLSFSSPTHPESRASACSTECLPGEPIRTTLSSHPLRRLLFHALLQPLTFYARPRSARSRSRATSGETKGSDPFSMRCSPLFSFLSVSPSSFFFPFRCFPSLRHSVVPHLRFPFVFPPPPRSNRKGARLNYFPLFLCFPYLPGEPIKTPFSSPPLRRSLFHAALQASTFYALARSARSRSRATSQLSPGCACFST
jgi:hypothetical protein